MTYDIEAIRERKEREAKGSLGLPFYERDRLEKIAANFGYVPLHKEVLDSYWRKGNQTMGIGKNTLLGVVPAELVRRLLATIGSPESPFYRHFSSLRQELASYGNDPVLVLRTGVTEAEPHGIFQAFYNPNSGEFLGASDPELRFPPLNTFQ